MDNNTGYLEYIIPIIFFAIWVVGRIFGRKAAQEQSPGPDSEDTRVYPLKEQFEKVTTSVEHQIEKLQEKKSVEFKREIEERKYAEKRIIENNLNFPVKSSERNEQRSALLDLLKGANSLKKAILVAEILNVPVALRRDERKKY